MKCKLLILVFILFSFGLLAQTPEWEWAVQAGGNEDSSGKCITTDNFGNSYIVGNFQEDISFGELTLISNGWQDVFVAKMDSEGNWLWAIQAGGIDTDIGYGISCDNSGSIYITGSFRATANFGEYSVTSFASSDIFVAKIDNNGNWLWVSSAGGNNMDMGDKITLDEFGNAYLTGKFFSSVAFFGNFSIPHTGFWDIFVAKINPNGIWEWVTHAGGDGWDNGYGITLDDEENIFIAGSFFEEISFGQFSLISYGETNAFVAKLNPDGIWQWAVKAGSGGNSWDESYDIESNNNGNLFITGCFTNTATFGDYSITSNGYIDAFVACLDANGIWQWVVNAGGVDWDKGNAIKLNSDGNIAVIGEFWDLAHFGPFSFNNIYYGADVFVAEIDTEGNWQWAVNAGGVCWDSGNSISLDYDDNIYCLGNFSDTIFFDLLSLTSLGLDDVFVAKLGSNSFAENGIIPYQSNLNNYPNPFNPSTTIEFSIQNDSKVELMIFNIKGQKIKTLANDQYSKGNHSVIWNGDNESGEPVGSSVYLYKLNVNSKIELMKKCLLLK
jgi:hypothetical protein